MDITRHETPAGRTDGSVATEYAILAGFIAAVIVLAVTAVGIATRGLFTPLLGRF